MKLVFFHSELHQVLSLRSSAAAANTGDGGFESVFLTIVDSPLLEFPQAPGYVNCAAELNIGQIQAILPMVLSCLYYENMLLGITVYRNLHLPTERHYNFDPVELLLVTIFLSFDV